MSLLFFNSFWRTLWSLCEAGNGGNCILKYFIISHQEWVQKLKCPSINQEVQNTTIKATTPLENVEALQGVYCSRSKIPEWSCKISETIYLWSLVDKAKVRLTWKCQEFFPSCIKRIWPLSTRSQRCIESELFQFLSGIFDHVHCTPCNRRRKTKYQWRPCFCSLKSKQCPTFLRHKKECTYVFQLTYIFLWWHYYYTLFSITFML